MTTITQTVAALPAAPTRDDPANFSARGDALMTALPAMVTQLNTANTQLNTVAGEVNTNAIAVASNAVAAAASAAAAANTAGAAAWASATAYALNQCAISQVNFLTYRRKVAGTTATDPANDSTNWVAIAGQSIPTFLIFTSSTTWVCPSGVFRIKLVLIGGGGSSGAYNAGIATGGTGGTTVIKYLTVTPGTTYTITIGAGGVAVTTATSIAGNAGGTSSFSGSGIATVTAPGGGGGGVNINSTAGTNGTGCDLSIIGGISMFTVTTASGVAIGGGTTLSLGTAPNTNGDKHGAGGGGSWSSTTGTAGAPGVATLEY